MLWSRCGRRSRDSVRRLIRSCLSDLPGCCIIFVLSDFHGVFDFSAVVADHFHFHQMMRLPFIPNTSPAARQYRFPIEISCVPLVLNYKHL